MSATRPGMQNAALSAGGLLVVAAALVVAWGSVTTSSAEFRASTGTAGTFAAGTIVVDRPSTSASLLFRAEGLYPGAETWGCTEIDYEGSIPATLRLHATNVGGSGLEDYLELRLLLADEGSCDRSDGQPSATAEVVFDGPLSEFLARHPSYADGIELEPRAEAGDRLVVAGIVSMVDDDRAQGLTTGFDLTVEARVAPEEVTR